VEDVSAIQFSKPTELSGNSRAGNLPLADLSSSQPKRVLRQYGLYLVFYSPEVFSCWSSSFCQLELGLYSFMALARTSVCLPRSF
jgi:hypothetical protein